MKSIGAFILMFFFTNVGYSFNPYQDTLILGTINEITLLAPRPKQVLPWTYTKDSLHQIDYFQNNLRNALDRRSGIQSFNGENFAQDLRIAIRGFGSRSVFGVRGIRLYIDEIPLTSPDGTSQLDEISIFDVANIEIVRSGLAARLGNAGGGAIALSTYVNEFASRVMVTSRINSLGSYDVGLKYKTSSDKISNLLSVNHHRYKGNRDYSSARTTTVYNTTGFQTSDKLNFTLISGFYISPEGKDPGALTDVQFMENRWQANARNLQYQAGEAVKGAHIALKINYDIAKHIAFKTILFYRKRIFLGKLATENYGIVDLNRDFVGIVNSVDFKGLKNSSFLIGQSIECQNDRRKLSQNVLGLQSMLQADQNEKVCNNAIFQQFQWQKGRLFLHQLLRYDFSVYSLNNLFVSNGVQNGRRSFNNINGALGIGLKIDKKSILYANLSTSFEMPTLNELTNNPSGNTGFNPTLNPESAIQTEVGLKSSQKQTFKWAISAYYIQIKQQIQGFELAVIQGKTFFRNAAQSERKGIDAEIKLALSPSINLSVNYSFSDYKFTNYLVGSSNLSGNKQPLIPAHKLNLAATIPISAYITAEGALTYNDVMWLDDVNLTKSKAYMDANIVLSSTPWYSKKIVLGCQLNNVFNSMVYSNFRVNAAAGRYYEAASQRSIACFVQYNIN